MKLKTAPEPRRHGDTEEIVEFASVVPRTVLACEINLFFSRNSWYFLSLCLRVSVVNAFSRLKPTVRIALVCSLLTILTAGCSSTPRITYYSLGTPAEPAAVTETSFVRKELPSVSVESVTVPELVDRLQLVERTNISRIEILELHRWAEPLKSSIPRSIADNLSRLLASDRISVYPQNAGSHAAYQVFIDFQRFESEGTAVSVDALWTIRRATDGGQKSGRKRVHEATGGAGYEAVVSAYSRALTAVSGDIARALRAEWDGAARPCMSGSDAPDRLFCQ